MNCSLVHASSPFLSPWEDQPLPLLYSTKMLSVSPPLLYTPVLSPILIRCNKQPSLCYFWFLPQTFFPTPRHRFSIPPRFSLLLCFPLLILYPSTSFIFPTWSAVCFPFHFLPFSFPSLSPLLLFVLLPNPPPTVSWFHPLPSSWLSSGFTHVKFDLPLFSKLFGNPCFAWATFLCSSRNLSFSFIAYRW